MDRAIYVASAWIVVAAVISYLLIQDSVVSGRQHDETEATPEREPERELVGAAAE